MNIKRIVCLLLAILCLNFGILNQVEAAIIPKRIGGPTRYDTSILISQSGWIKNSEYAVVVSGENFEDAMCAVPLAKKYNAPILLTPKNKLNNSTEWINLNQELCRLKVKKILLLGGENSISPDIENEFIDDGIEVTRIDGKNECDISFKIAEIVGVKNGIIMVNDQDYVDSVAISSIAASKGMPLILVPKIVNDAYKKNIEKISKSAPKAYAIEDDNLMNSDILGKFNNVDMISGKDEYERNINIIKKFEGSINYDTVYLASGSDLVDGLLGSTMAALTSSPIILVKDKYDYGIQDYFKDKLNLIKNINVLGGQDVISNSILEDTLSIFKNQITDGEIQNDLNGEGVSLASRDIDSSNYVQLNKLFEENGEKSNPGISIVNSFKSGEGLKDTPISEKGTTLGNLEKNITIQIAGIDMQTVAWLAIDTDKNNSGIKEIVKIPDTVYSYLPNNFEGKQYIVLDAVKMMKNYDDSDLSFGDIGDFEKNFQPEFANFLKKYSEEWNSGFNFITYKGLMRMDTESGTKYAKIYNLNFTDITFKSILDYVPQNFIQDREFISFLKQLLITFIDLSKDGNKDLEKRQLEQAFDNMYSDPEMAIYNIKNFINAMKYVNIIGDEGVDITYNVCDGYIIGEDGTVDLNTNVDRLISFISDISKSRKKVTLDNMKSNLGLGFNFTVESYNRNKENLKINLPKITDNNSIDYDNFFKVNYNK